MATASSRIMAAVIIAAALCCTAMGKKEPAPEGYCPKCKKRLVMHKAPGRSTRRHRHVRYICPDCRKTWSGPADETGKEELVCPKCGSALKECPDCCKKSGE